MRPNRVEILGVPVDCVSMNEALHWAEAFIKTGTPHSVISVNPEKIMKAQSDPLLLRELEGASLLIPDGIGVVFAVRLLTLGHIQRVPGSEFMPKLCELAAIKGYRVFLFGASPQVNEATTRILREKFIGLNIVGSQHGYVDEEDMSTVIEAINVSQADILFIALGSPRQELWISQYLSALQVKVCQGVGGTFDVIAGQVRRAPWIFRSIHLEWLYRLLAQPSRLVRQKALPLFAIQVLKKRFLTSQTKFAK